MLLALARAVLGCAQFHFDLISNGSLSILFTLHFINLRVLRVVARLGCGNEGNILIIRMWLYTNVRCCGASAAALFFFIALHNQNAQRRTNSISPLVYSWCRSGFGVVHGTQWSIMITESRWAFDARWRVGKQRVYFICSSRELILNISVGPGVFHVWWMHIVRQSILIQTRSAFQMNRKYRHVFFPSGAWKWFVFVCIFFHFGFLYIHLRCGLFERLLLPTAFCSAAWIAVISESEVDDRNECWNAAMRQANTDQREEGGWTKKQNAFHICSIMRCTRQAWHCFSALQLEWISALRRLERAIPVNAMFFGRLFQWNSASSPWNERTMKASALTEIFASLNQFWY